MKRNRKVKGEKLKVKGLLGWIVLSIFTFQFSICQAQSDSALNRSVTVERDFQPVIQAAGKVSTHPAVMETSIEPAPIEYSEFTADINPGTAFHPLLSQPTRFEPGKKYHGYIRGAIGHPNTLFDFGYHLDDGKKSILDVYAHHKAQWGIDALSRTKLGLEFTHTFSACNLYFGVNGGNIYYHKYGHWYDYAGSAAAPGADFGMWEKNKTAYALRAPLTAMDKTSLWTAEAYVGIKANAKNDVQYRVQTGYNLFSKPEAVSEHQIRTHADFDWHSEAHHVGAVFNMQNNFLQLASLATQIPDSLYNARHNFRIEPYYAYEGKRFRLHLGVNLDLNVGRGKNSLSASENVTFAPSPHIRMEAQIAKQWLTIYADATGNHGLGTLQGYMEANRYRVIHAGIISRHPASHTPVDAELGFHIRPHRDLLIQLHGGYMLQLNTMTLIAVSGNAVYQPGVLNVPMTAGDFSYTYSDYGRGKVGGQINYHYRDIVRINLNGDYFFWYAFRHEANRYQYNAPCPELTSLLGNTSKAVYDRAAWKIDFRIDGKIDKHWSVYSDNHFVGSRLALATDGEHVLKPVVALNLGAEYNMWVGKKRSAISRQQSEGGMALRPEPKPNLTLFVQLNNWLHRKNEIYYGYREQGINCLIGATFRF